MDVYTRPENNVLMSRGIDRRREYYNNLSYLILRQTSSRLLPLRFYSIPVTFLTTAACCKTPFCHFT